jgi:hypothetical protein
MGELRRGSLDGNDLWDLRAAVGGWLFLGAASFFGDYPCDVD